MQLDFIGTIKPKSFEPTQFELWTNGRATKIKREPSFEKVEKFFNTSIDGNTVDSYKNYWQSLAPKSDAECFQKWLFAFLSVHSSWESNVRGYKALKDWTQWFNRWEVLEAKLIESKIGLHNNRTKFIKEFSLDYWNNLSEFKKKQNENWPAFRDRLTKRVLGLGFAKISFALEMIYPLEAQVACIDTHIYQAYGLNQSKDSSFGEKIEKHWVEMSKMWNCPAPLSRAIYWDKMQGKTDSSYWMNVFH